MGVLAAASWSLDTLISTAEMLRQKLSGIPGLTDF
jgi:hypothetical protein